MSVDESLLKSALGTLFLENNEWMDEVAVELSTVDVVPEFC